MLNDFEGLLDTAVYFPVDSDSRYSLLEEADNWGAAVQGVFSEGKSPEESSEEGKRVDIDCICLLAACEGGAAGVASSS